MRSGNRRLWPATWRSLCLLGLIGLAMPPGVRADTAELPDAFIELWEQSWTLTADGSRIFHEKQHVRLNDERAYGEFADPRIPYNEDTDTLEILVARTKLPDGTYIEAPEYAHVNVSPNASAGWPAFANIRQHLIVMSGIEPGCVVELEYKRTTRGAAGTILAGDIRLDHRYPIHWRRVVLNVPPGVTLKTARTHLPASPGAVSPNEIILQKVEAVREEPQASPWQTRSARLVFTTAGEAGEWARMRCAQLERAADSSDLIRKLADEWTRDVKDPAARLRALQEKLAATFNFVDLPIEWRPATIRPASEVLHGNYGLRDEAAAVLLALARAAGLSVSPGILVRDELWDPEVPQESMVAAYVVVLAPESGGPGGSLELFEPQRGRVTRDARWAGCTLLPTADATRQPFRLASWTAADESRCSLSAKLAVANDGHISGTLALRTTGLFTNSENLRSGEAQKSRIGGLLARLVPDMSIESFAVKTLTPGEFEATAQVKSSKPLGTLSDRLLLMLAQDGPFLGDVPLPLAYRERATPVRITGPFCEDVDLRLEWPEKWQLEAGPRELTAVEGAWGGVSQTVTVDKQSLRLHRTTRVTQTDLSAGDFRFLREPLNELRSEAARVVTLVKP